MRKIAGIGCLFLLFLPLAAQNHVRTLSAIKIEGNTITKPAVFYREIGKEIGDTIQHPDAFAAVVQNRLSGLTLFTYTAVQWNSDTLKIQVKEKVYIWGMPRLTWADRNFTVWSATADPKRLDYGGTLYFNNLGGNHIKAFITGIAGYNQLLEFSVFTPFLKHSKGWAFGVYGKHQTNHELWYATKENKVAFVSTDDERIQKNTTFALIQKARFSYFNHIEIAQGFNQFLIDSAAYIANKYYLNNTTQQREWYVASDFVSDHRNQRDYPSSGYYFRAGMRLGISNNTVQNTPFFSVHARASRFSKPFRNSNVVFVKSISSRYTHFPNVYIYQRQLGYSSDYVRGYEPYVMDGAGYVLGKLGLRKPLLSNRTVKLKAGKWLNSYRYIPISCWFNIFADAGAAFMPSTLMPFSQTNNLQQQLLSGTGVGIDVLVWYNAMTRFEYSVNQMGKGFFNISFKNAF